MEIAYGIECNNPQNCHRRDGVKDNNHRLNQVMNEIMGMMDEPSWNAVRSSVMLVPWRCVKVSSVKILGWVLSTNPVGSLEGCNGCGHSTSNTLDHKGYNVL